MYCGRWRSWCWFRRYEIRGAFGRIYIDHFPPVQQRHLPHICPVIDMSEKESNSDALDIDKGLILDDLIPAAPTPAQATASIVTAAPTIAVATPVPRGLIPCSTRRRGAVER